MSIQDVELFIVVEVQCIAQQKISDAFKLIWSLNIHVYEVVYCKVHVYTRNVNKANFNYTFKYTRLNKAREVMKMFLSHT